MSNPQPVSLEEIIQAIKSIPARSPAPREGLKSERPVFGIRFGEARFKGMEAKNGDHHAAICRVRNWAANAGKPDFDEWLFLVADPADKAERSGGTGKTHMLAASHRVLSLRGVEHAACEMGKFFESVKSVAFGDDGPGIYAATLARIRGPMIFDEIGARAIGEGDALTAQKTPTEAEIMRIMFNFCYENRIPVLGATNLRADELADYLDFRIVSRYQGHGVTVECKWPTFRRK